MRLEGRVFRQNRMIREAVVEQTMFFEGQFTERIDFDRFQIKLL